MTNDVDASTRRSIRRRQTIRLVASIAAFAPIVMFAVVNTRSVSVDWLFDEAETSLWIVIAASAVVGFAIGYATRWRRS